MSVWEWLAYIAFDMLGSAQELCLNENASPRAGLTLLISEYLKSVSSYARPYAMIFSF